LQSQQALKKNAIYSSGEKMNIGMRWLLFPGIDTLCFDISLFVLQIPIRTIIVFLRNLFTVSCIVEICCKVETTKNVDIIM